MIPPNPALSRQALCGTEDSAELHKALQLQQLTMTTSVQWTLPLALLLILSVLWQHVGQTALLAWALVAAVATLLTILNNGYNRKQLAVQQKPDLRRYLFRNTLNYALLGSAWGILPLVSALWGDERALWISLLVSTALIPGLALVLSSSMRNFWTAFLPTGALTLGAIAAGPLLGAELVLLGLLFLVAVALLQRTLYTLQEMRARTALVQAANAAVQNHSQARHDPLTGLLNRMGLDVWLQEQLDADDGSAPALVTLATVVGFGELNALYGNSVADAVLRELASRLQRESRGMFGVTRISGTEFILVDLRPLANHEDLLKMLSALEHEPFKIDNQTVAVGFRKVWVRGSARELDTLIDHARTQLHSLPAEHRREEHSPGVSLALRRELVQSFHQALASEQIQPWFQPVVDCGSNRIIGWEALARWQHPQHGPIDPDTFLVIARVSRQLPLLSRTMFHTSALLVRALCTQGLADCAKVHVNLGADELGKTSTLAWIEQTLQDAGVAPEHFVIELSEQDAPVLDEQLRCNLRRMRELGMQLALDDFGTGHANLDRLLDLSPQVVKLDKRFITTLPEDPASVAVVSAAVALASHLGMQSIAEGVETDAQLDCLLALGCRAYQGFRADRALPFQQALDLARHWPQQSRQVALAS